MLSKHQDSSTQNFAFQLLYIQVEKKKFVVVVAEAVVGLVDVNADIGMKAKVFLCKLFLVLLVASL